MNTIKAMSHLAVYSPKQIPDYKEIRYSYVSKLRITLLITTSYSYARIHVSGAGYLGKNIQSCCRTLRVISCIYTECQTLCLHNAYRSVNLGPTL